MRFTHATASRIKTYKQCAFRYFLEYVIEYPPARQSNIYAEKGSAVHEALEYYANAVLRKEDKSEYNWLKILKDYYASSKLWELDDRAPDKGGFPHPVEKTCESCPWATKDNRCEIADDKIDNVNGCPRPNFESDVELIEKTLTRTDYEPLKLVLDEFGEPVLEDDKLPTFERKIIGAEVPFDMELNGTRVRGVIDLVTEADPDTIEIVDYKTGRSMSYNKAYTDPQVRIYGAVARKLWPQYKNVMVTLYYLKTSEVSVPLSPCDDEKTLASLQINREIIENDDDPRQVNPSKWGFPCNWCVGRDTCDKIRDTFVENGRFKLPTITCGFTSPTQPCYGNLHPVPGQDDIAPEDADKIIYACSGHSKCHDGGEYRPEKKNDGS